MLSNANTKHYYQFYQKPYSISTPGIFGYIATHMIVKIFYYHVPPWYWAIPGGDMIVKMFLLSCPPLVLNNTRGGHVIEAIYSVFPCFWLILCLGFNQIDSNVNTVRLARRYWEILSSFFEIGVQYGPRACGPRSILKPQFLRIQIVFPNTSSPDAQYSSIVIGKKINYSVLYARYFPITCHLFVTRLKNLMVLSNTIRF